MRPVLRRGRHRDHHAAERNRHRHLLREHPGRHRHQQDGYRDRDRREDDQKKVQDRPSERSLPVRASFPGLDADRHQKVRHHEADEDHQNVRPVRLQDAGDVRRPVRRRERDALPHGHPGYRRDEACPGWMHRGCFRGGGHRGEALPDEVHPAWVLRRQRDGVHEARPAWELHPAWGQRREYHLQGEHPAWAREFPSRFRLLRPSEPQP